MSEAFIENILEDHASYRNRNQIFLYLETVCQNQMKTSISVGHVLCNFYLKH